MSRPIVIPTSLLAHAERATAHALAEARRIDDLPETEWPEDFDRNDIPLFQMILDSIEKARQAREETLSIGGKPGSFLRKLIIDYVRSNHLCLGADEAEALKE